MSSELIALAVSKIINVGSNVVANLFDKPDWDARLEAEKKYYQKIQEIQQGKQPVNHKELNFESKPIEADQTKGTACLSCCQSHIITASGALGEAVRFSRSEELDNPEIVNRLAIATEELTIMERIDLTPDKIQALPSSSEQELSNWSVKKSREIRHLLDKLRTKDDLLEVSALANKVRNKYRGDLLNIKRAKN